MTLPLHVAEEIARLLRREQRLRADGGREWLDARRQLAAALADAPVGLWQDRHLVVRDAARFVDDRGRSRPVETVTSSLL